MNLITFREPLTIAFKKSAGGAQITFEANKEYLLSNSQMDRILKDQNVLAKYYRVSRIENRIQNFHVKAFPPKTKLLIFNGGGGYGDQILTWPVAHILSKRFGFQVHVLTDPGNNCCWWGFPWVKSVQVIPCAWEQIKLFDAFAPMESVVNMDEHADQEHPVDAMLRKMGVDPETIDPSEKCVRPNFTQSEMGSLMSIKQKYPRLGLYQLAPANPIRGLPPADSAWLALKLAEATPGIHWLCLHDEFVPKEYREVLETKAVERKQSNLQAFVADNLRELWALAEHVDIVVSPDSMMVHVAGMFGTPCVGLWGPLDPVKRVAYYKNHHPLWHREFCPHSPCFAYSSVFPRYCPPRPDVRKSCDVLAGISPAELIETVKRVARPGPPVVHIPPAATPPVFSMAVPSATPPEVKMPLPAGTVPAPSASNGTNPT